MKILTDKEQAVSECIDEAGRQLKLLVTQSAEAIADCTAQFGTPDGDRHRWNAIAKTHFQEGLAALRRAVEAPEHF